MDLFSGLGGFALAARWTRWQTIGFSEVDPYCCKLLTKNFPGVPNYGDITKLDGRTITADLITAGWPCQPFSLAGKQQGQDDERYLWPEVLRVIDEAKPVFFLGENVPGLIGMALERVCTDLESLGFEVQPLIIPACAVNAPHRRDRVWIIAYATSHAGQLQQSERQDLRNESAIYGTTRTAPNTGSQRRQQNAECTFSNESQNEGRSTIYNYESSSSSKSGTTADASRHRGERPKGQDWQPHGGGGEPSGVDALRNGEIVTNSTSDLRRASRDDLPQSSDWGSTTLTDSQSQQVGATRQSWLNGSVGTIGADGDGRLAEPGVRGIHDGLPSGLDGIAGGFWDRDTAIPPLAEGVRDRVSRLKALGNAIVPQVAAQILKAMKEGMR